MGGPPKHKDSSLPSTRQSNKHNCQSTKVLGSVTGTSGHATRQVSLSQQVGFR